MKALLETLIEACRKGGRTAGKMRTDAAGLVKQLREDGVCETKEEANDLLRLFLSPKYASLWNGSVEGGETSGMMIRTTAYNKSNSNACLVLFLPQYNVVYVIGNKQTTRKLKSSMWGGTYIERSKFSVIKLASDVDVSTLEAGLKLQDELNKALEGLGERSVDERISALITQGVVGYRHPMIHCKGWATHFEEIAAIAKNEKNWICTDDSNGAK
eukprot:scaffold29059_cov67-Skeletonema_dohrnii-CCMP3373.AAC.1